MLKLFNLVSVLTRNSFSTNKRNFVYYKYLISYISKHNFTKFGCNWLQSTNKESVQGNNKKMLTHYFQKLIIIRICEDTLDFIDYIQLYKNIKSGK